MKKKILVLLCCCTVLLHGCSSNMNDNDISASSNMAIPVTSETDYDGEDIMELPKNTISIFGIPYTFGKTANEIGIELEEEVVAPKEMKPCTIRVSYVVTGIVVYNDSEKPQSVNDCPIIMIFSDMNFDTGNFSATDIDTPLGTIPKGGLMLQNVPNKISTVPYFEEMFQTAEVIENNQFGEDADTTKTLIYKFDDLYYYFHFSYYEDMEIEMVDGVNSIEAGLYLEYVEISTLSPEEFPMELYADIKPYTIWHP